MPSRSTYFNPATRNSRNLKFRQKRFEFFIGLLNQVRSDQRPLRILDIGGLEVYWERMNFLGANSDVRITLLNLEKVKTKYDNVISVKGDACSLAEFKDQEFDVVFSNSVIEHLFSKENHKRMADEAARVGKYYYIQTPNYYFPIEPHWMFPCFQFLPFGTRVFLTRHFSLGHFPRIANIDEARRLVSEVNLLTEKEMKKLFPDGKVYREMFLGLTKSVTMYRF